MSAASYEAAESAPVRVKDDTLDSFRPPVEEVYPEQKAESQGTKSTRAAQDLTNRALDFISNASNETLGACFVGLGATTYLVLGRVGLVLIGIAGGVALHASWENHAGEGGEEAKAKEIRRRREVGLDVVKRVLDWREEEAPNRGGTRESESHSLAEYKAMDFAGYPPETKEALNALTDAVIRDYVKYWYGPILPHDVAFPTSARKTLTSFLSAVSSHLSRKRPADTFLDFLTNSSSIMIVFISEISGAIASMASYATPAEAVADYLAVNPESNLAHLLDETHQKKKLENVAEDILQNFLDPKAYNCEPVRVFLKQMLAGVVLEMSMQSCAKPDWINSWIIYLLEEGEPELLNVIDASVGAETGGLVPGTSGKDQNSNAEPIGQHRRDSSDGQHGTRLTKAEEAMEEAMIEAKRLSQLMAEEDAKKGQEEQQIGLEPQQLPGNVGAEVEPKADEAGLQSQSSESLHKTASREAREKRDSNFTSFDQLVPTSGPTALHSGPSSPTTSLNPPSPSAPGPPFTLTHAKVSIFDDSTISEKSVLRNKPTADYLIQIEPALSSYSGWMIARKYAEFESLHETLRRISAVSGAKDFADRYAAFPQWKGRTKAAVRNMLESYLQDALRYKQLAETERMKRFCEKEQAFGPRSPAVNGKNGLENVGKSMLGAFTNAPKGAAAGGQAILGGVNSVFGSVSTIGQKRSPASENRKPAGSNQSANGSRPDLERTESANSVRQTSRTSHDSHQSSPSLQAIPAKTWPAQPPRPSFEPEGQGLSSTNGKSSTDLSQASSAPIDTPESSPSQTEEEMHLPPPPSEISDHFDGSWTNESSRRTLDLDRASHDVGRPSIEKTVSTGAPSSSQGMTSRTSLDEGRSSQPPISDAETRVAVSLLFALLTELYTLSSITAFRRTFLTAARTYMLRPGPNNTSLDAIRVLLQDSVIESNTSDAAIATHIHKLRENSLPTEEETQTWDKEFARKGGVEGEADRIAKEKERARKLFIERGVPQALKGVMGAAATGEALGKLWDCLQVEQVARGLVFGVMLQGLKAMIQ